MDKHLGSSPVLRSTLRLMDLQADSPEPQADGPLGERAALGSEPMKATTSETRLSLPGSASRAKQLVLFKLTRALLTQQLLLLALELVCTTAPWPLLELSLRIKCMNIKEKRLEPIWDFREMPPRPPTSS